jgi:hypothetical protein
MSIYGKLRASVSPGIPLTTKLSGVLVTLDISPSSYSGSLLPMKGEGSDV